MKAWEKIESSINLLLTKIGGSVYSLFKKLTPKSVNNKYNKLQDNLNSKKQKIKGVTNSKRDLALQKLLRLKKKTLDIKSKALVKSQTLATSAKNFNPKEVDYKKKLLLLFAIITPFFFKIKSWVLSLKPITLLGAISTTTIVGLTAISFYSQVEKISDKLEEDNRSIASVDTKGKKAARAIYHKQTEKELKMTNMDMPLYVGESKKLKSVILDFTIISSNRYIPNFFFKKPYYVRDKLNSTLHPFIPELPLEEEGKIIIKNKIKKEINNLLKELKIKGEIKEIHIHSLLAG